jgi:TonB family protein
MPRRTIAIIVPLVLLASGLRAAPPREETKAPFEPVQVLRVVPPDYPSGSIATGTVILKVTVGPSGNVRRLDVTHGIASLTSAAEQAVRRWQFRPARLAGSTTRSSTTAAISFVSTFASVPSWTAPPTRERASRFEPVQAVSVTGAVFPFTSGAVQGYPPFVTVVLRVTVGRSGDIAHIDVLRGVTSLTKEAERTLRKWHFRPARLGGMPVASQMIATFTFRLWLGPMNSPQK